MSARLGNVPGIAVVRRHTIDEQHFVAHFQHIARHADQPLDQPHAILGRGECDHVPALWIAQRRQGNIAQGQLEIVGQPIDQYHIALKQSRTHGARRNRVPVRHGGPEDAETQEKDQQPTVIDDPALHDDL